MKNKLPYILEIDSLNKKFNNKTIISNASFKLKKGQVIGLTGKNGSGKTTLFKIISGIMHPTSGNGKIQDKYLFSSNPDYRKYLIYWSHYPQFYSSLTGYENIKLFLNLRSEFDQVHLIKDYAEKYDLKNQIFQKISKYSFGQIQRLKLIQLAISNWDLALLDEPHSGIDIDGKKILDKNFNKWSKMEKTIFIISHNKVWLEGNCDTIFNLENSKLYKND